MQNPTFIFLNVQSSGRAEFSGIMFKLQDGLSHGLKYYIHNSYKSRDHMVLEKAANRINFFNILIKFDPAPPLSCFFSLFNLCSSFNFVLHLTFLPVFLFLSVPLTYLLVLNLTLLSSAFPLLCEFSKFLYSLSLFFL